ncbi:hypothetical protein [Corallococcus carmarthensis]|uniref:Uncharacterized protein n=1 Tax=Corallococcus carmarthensis TaxID=2316728 RepID=A0A3A8K8L1_9BACT|nr:hypothetical protein [Corallococcus carmarthensis]NOK15742.1 hypothetical protein [Corallococcus carmarthensis]RKG98771.1 hypothetical protein D7X32_28645 [Corallococcus carmarthensis]
MKHFLLSAAAVLGLASAPAQAQAPGPFSPFAPFELRVNFQPANAPVPAGFVADSGQVYGSAARRPRISTSSKR